MGHNGFFFPVFGIAEICFKLLLRGNPRVTQWQKNAPTPSPRPKEEAGEAEHTSESPSVVYSTQDFIFFPQSWARGACRHTKPRAVLSLSHAWCRKTKLTGRAQHARKAPSHKLMGEKVKTPSQQSHNPSFHPKPTPKTPPSGSWLSAWGRWQAAAPEVTPWQQRAPRCGVGVPATTQGPPFSPSPRAGKQLNVRLIPG